MSMTSFFIWRSSQYNCLRRHRTPGLELFDELLDRVRRFVEPSLLVRRQLDLDDLFDAVSPQLHRHANKEALVTVLPLQERRARKDLALVFENRLDHLDRGRSRRVPRRGLEQIHDLRAAVASAVDDGIDTLLREQLRDRN